MLKVTGASVGACVPVNGHLATAAYRQTRMEAVYNAKWRTDQH